MTAPCRTSGVASCKYFTGSGSPLHALMCGLHGVDIVRCVNTAQLTATMLSASTATGRRCQLFSPPDATNGTASNPAIIRIGAIKINGVSIDGGKYDRTA